MTSIMKTMAFTTLAGGLSVTLFAQNPFEKIERRGELDVFATGTYLFGDTSGVKAPPGAVDFQETVDYQNIYGGGIGATYYFSDHFNVSLALFAGQTDTEVTTVETVRGATQRSVESKGCFTSGANIMLGYTVLKTRLTPVLEAGFGGLGVWDVPRVKEPIARTGNTVHVCRTDGFFSISGGGGVRWDITERWYAKVIYRLGYYLALNTDLLDDCFFHGPTFSVGYRF